MIEIALHIGPNFTTHWGKTIELKNSTAWNLAPKQRKRLQENYVSGGTESWFRFEDCKSDEDYLAVAEAAARELLAKVTLAGPVEAIRPTNKLPIVQRLKALLLPRQ